MKRSKNTKKKKNHPWTVPFSAKELRRQTAIEEFLTWNDGDFGGPTAEEIVDVYERMHRSMKDEER